MTDFVKIAFMKEYLEEAGEVIREKINRLYGLDLTLKQVLELTITKHKEKKTIRQMIIDELLKIYEEQGLQFSEELHAFIKGESRTKKNFTEYLKMINIDSIPTLLRVLSRDRQEILKKTVEEFKEIYDLIRSQYKCSEQTFSYLAQSATTNPSRKYDKVELGELFFQLIDSGKTQEEAEQQINAWQKLIWNKIASATSANEQEIKRMLLGRAPQDPTIIKALERELEYGPISEIIKDTLTPKITKEKILEAAGISQEQYPLSNLRFWPDDCNSVFNKSSILDKIGILLNVDKPKRLGAILRTLNKKNHFASPEENKLKHLLLEKLQRNENKFISLIKEAMSEMGYDDTYINDFVDSAQKATEADPRMVDDQYKELGDSFSYDSMMEKEVVNLFRNEFELQCVPSNIRVPIPNDFALNKSHFIIDFIVYCDVLNGLKKVIENGAEYNIPDITIQALLVGEYYGWDSVQPEKTLTEDLFYPDGTLAFPAGHNLTKGEAYKYKTKFKEVTEEFCARAIGCKTIAIHKANNSAEAIQEIMTSLDNHKAIYHPVKVQLKENSAINILKSWYKETDNLSKQKSIPIVSKYINVNTGELLPGKDYKYDRYIGLIENARKYIEVKELTFAIKRDYNQFNSKLLFSLAQSINNIMSQKGKQQSLGQDWSNIHEEEKMAFVTNPYFKQIGMQLIKYHEENKWRYDALNELKAMVKECRANQQPIDIVKLNDYINIIQDLGNNQYSVRGGFDLRKGGPDPDIVATFNLHKLIRRANLHSTRI